MFATSVGYGALARDLGFDLGQTLWAVAVFFALPAQLVYIDQMPRGVGLFSVAVLVALTAVRFVPMAVTMMPQLRGAHRMNWKHFIAAHFIVTTTWVETNNRLPTWPPGERLTRFSGFGVGLIFCNVVGAGLGFLAMNAVPPVVTAALLFMTPIYFLLSLIQTSAGFRDHLAILLGCLLGPLLLHLVPGLDLLATGLIGGTAAYFVGRVRR